MVVQTIPVIDLAPLRHKDGIVKVAEAFRSAYETVGFGAIINHGIPNHVVVDLFTASKNFHAQPLQKKMAVKLDDAHRGYIPINTSTDVNSTLAEVSKPNQSESFMMMREDAPDSSAVLNNVYLSGPNQWPEISGFKPALTHASQLLSALAVTLIEVACASLEVGSNRVLPAFECPTTWLRLLHYPPQPMHSSDDLYGSAPHTDFGCLTILMQDDVAGLQVLSRNASERHRWIDVPPMAGAMVVNVGDMLHRWSNGILKSTPHRVINRSGRERYSCAFFFDPWVETIIEPLPECITRNNPRQFEAVHFGRYLQRELMAAYEQHRRDGEL